MTDHRQLAFADLAEAADLAAYLGRQLRWDRKATARLQVRDGLVAVFTQPARFGVLAVWSGRLREPAELDRTVAAGELLDGIDEERAAVTVPGPVTGPAWAGVLPPRGGWTRLAELATADVRAAAHAVVAEFRERTERLAPPERTRAALDAVAEEVWARPLAGTPLPLRAVHAAHALGFLRGAAPVVVLSSGVWLRLRTPAGSIAVRRRGAHGLSLTPA